MPRVSKRAVVFDFDGVVADSWALHERAWASVLQPLGGAVPEEALKRSLGLSSVETAKVVIEACDLDADPLELGQAKSRYFAQHADEVEPMTGAPEAIKRLGERFPVAVTAIRMREGVERFLRKFELEDQLTAVVCRDDLDQDATLEQVLTATAKALELAPAKCVMIEDTRNGLLAAERVGFKSIAFNSNPKHDLDFSMADSVVSALDELVPELVTTVTAR